MEKCRPLYLPFSPTFHLNSKATSCYPPIFWLKELWNEPWGYKIRTVQGLPPRHTNCLRLLFLRFPHPVPSTKKCHLRTLLSKCLIGLKLIGLIVGRCFQCPALKSESDLRQGFWGPFSWLLVTIPTRDTKHSGPVMSQLCSTQSEKKLFILTLRQPKVTQINNMII